VQGSLSSHCLVYRRSRKDLCAGMKAKRAGHALAICQHPRADRAEEKTWDRHLNTHAPTPSFQEPQSRKRKEKGPSRKKERTAHRTPKRKATGRSAEFTVPFPPFLSQRRGIPGMIREGKPERTSVRQGREAKRVGRERKNHKKGAKRKNAKPHSIMPMPGHFPAGS